MNLIEKIKVLWSGEKDIRIEEPNTTLDARPADDLSSIPTPAEPKDKEADNPDVYLGL
ncbi:hypothetical protein [Candidatus Synchoanobacter obligatus]|uniref:Uncharacterized protein n=1 Tax=Candidatus Synchoanobacter obligatus TaxID=2919597 RepID=A0ABT1L5M9_9GAMM|nr:hypothetical protein [Candidatus Synchoanobacter obligatus]MCP8352399.1 hypothetical protein [Candidatus Synchoanobacter obligatus]